MGDLVLRELEEINLQANPAGVGAKFAALLPVFDDVDRLDDVRARLPRLASSCARSAALPVLEDPVHELPGEHVELGLVGLCPPGPDKGGVFLIGRRNGSMTDGGRSHDVRAAILHSGTEVRFRAPARS